MKGATAPALELDVLVVDDDRSIRRTLRICLEAIGCRIYEASNAPAARAALEQRSYDVALLDVRLGRDNGLELCRRCSRAAPAWMSSS